MVKWISQLSSEQLFWVRILAGAQSAARSKPTAWPAAGFERLFYVLRSKTRKAPADVVGESWRVHKSVKCLFLGVSRTDILTKNSYTCPVDKCVYNVHKGQVYKVHFL